MKEAAGRGKIIVSKFTIKKHLPSLLGITILNFFFARR
jgi:hypothetical protein